MHLRRRFLQGGMLVYITHRVPDSDPLALDGESFDYLYIGPSSCTCVRHAICRKGWKACFLATRAGIRGGCFGREPMLTCSLAYPPLHL